MKGYYLFAPVSEGCDAPYSGIMKKILGQIKAMRERYDVELIVRPVERRGKLSRLLTRFPFFPATSRRWKYNGEFSDADFLYIRQVIHDRGFIRYLKQIKKGNGGIKIIYEMPSYPDEGESRVTLGNFHVIWKDHFYRKQLRRYVDRIVTFYGQEQILGVKTIREINGFDYSSVAVAPPAAMKRDRIDVIEVATLAFWHGYDRFIEGMKNYYHDGGQVNIVFHMVGSVPPEIARMVEQCGLGEHVIFHGPLYGEALDAVYDQCDLALDVLGGHRKNYPVSSSLKSREYAAKGLPVITASPIDYMDRDYPYQLILPYDDSPIDMADVIRFHDNIANRQRSVDVREAIRSYGARRTDYSVTLQPLFEYIEGKSTEE